VYACYDVNGDNLFGCGPEDFTTTYLDGAKLAVDAGKIAEIRLDLTAHTSALTSVTEPAARGCQ
jgi:hypothetical protein